MTYKPGDPMSDLEFADTHGSSELAVTLDLASWEVDFLSDNGFDFVRVSMKREDVVRLIKYLGECALALEAEIR